MKVELTHKCNSLEKFVDTPCNTKETRMVISDVFVTTKPYVSVTDPNFVLYMRAGIGKILASFDDKDNLLQQIDEINEIDDLVLFDFDQTDQIILSSQIITTYGDLGEIQKRAIHLRINYEEYLMACEEVSIPTNSEMIFETVCEAFYKAVSSYEKQLNREIQISDVEFQINKTNIQVYSELMYYQSLLELANPTFWVHRNVIAFTNDQINQVYKDTIYDEFRKILVDVKNQESCTYLMLKVNNVCIYRQRFTTCEDALDAFNKFSKGLDVMECCTMKMNEHRYSILLKDSTNTPYVMDAFITSESS